MQHFIYPENEYMHVDLHGRFAVEYNDDHEEFKFTTVADGVRVVNDLSVERAAMLAGYLLSKHPAIVKGDAMAFSAATRACDAIPEPDFTVITPGHELLATPEKQVAKDDEQEPGVGELHPDQERRLTALREASIIFGSDLSHDRIVGLAEWVLSGNAPTN